VREAGTLATSPADPLVEQFTASYGMVLQLACSGYGAGKPKQLWTQFGALNLATLDLLDDEARHPWNCASNSNTSVPASAMCPGKPLRFMKNQRRMRLRRSGACVRIPCSSRAEEDPWPTNSLWPCSSPTKEPW